MSEWISPAACHAVSPRRRCQDCAGLSSSAVKNAIRSSSAKAPVDDAAQAGARDPEVGAHRGRLVVVELGQLGLQAAEIATTPRAAAPPRARQVAGGTASSPSSTLTTKSTGLAVSGWRLAQRPGRVGGRRAPCGPGGRPAARRRASRSQRSSACSARVAAARLRGRRARGGARPARGRRSTSSVSIVSTSRSGSTPPSGWTTLASWCARTTWTIASVSRMLARNWLPRPSPSWAPRTRPAMSWKSIVSEHDARGADRLGDARRDARRRPARPRRWARSS